MNLRYYKLFQVIVVCALVSVARAGLIGGHGALSSQSIVLGGALSHGYAAAAPVLAAPGYGGYGYGGLGLGTVGIH